MRKLKRLATKADGVVIVHQPVPDEEMDSRKADYLLLSPVAFAKKYRHGLFQSTQIEYRDKKYEIQMNFCTNPYCGWFGLPQKRFETVKNKPFRYKTGGQQQ